MCAEAPQGKTHPLHSEQSPELTGDSRLEAGLTAGSPTPQWAGPSDP